MSGKNSPLYYWDSCIYFTWLNPDSPREEKNLPWITHIRAIIQSNESNNSRLVTSQLTMIEVLSCMEDDEVERKFQRVFNGHTHLRYDVDIRVVLEARRIRSAFLKEDPKIKLATPDAIHLATAIVVKADEFHTFDDGKMDGNKCSLLSLSGHGILKGLKICRPETAQTELPLMLLSSPSQEEQIPLLESEA